MRDVGACLLYRRIFSVTSGLYPLDISSSHIVVTIKMSLDIAKCYLWKKEVKSFAAFTVSEKGGGDLGALKTVEI